MLLTNDEFVEKFMYIMGVGEVLAIPGAIDFQLFPNDVVAKLYAFITDVNTRASNEFSNLMLALTAE
jgi:hypothetical protein